MSYKSMEHQLSQSSSFQKSCSPNASAFWCNQHMFPSVRAVTTVWSYVVDSGAGNKELIRLQQCNVLPAIKEVCSVPIGLAPRGADCVCGSDDVIVPNALCPHLALALALAGCGYVTPSQSQCHNTAWSCCCRC